MKKLFYIAAFSFALIFALWIVFLPEPSGMVPSEPYNYHVNAVRWACEGVTADSDIIDNDDPLYTHCRAMVNMLNHRFPEGSL